ncbi:ribulose-phosphate 3-epimerase [Chloroflexota bacterium]
MTRTKRVIPAILTEDREELKNMLSQAENFTDYVQIDIMDGQFVPSRSITHHDLLKLEIKIAWEAHLMVKQPEEHIEGFVKAGAQKVIFHFESTHSPHAVISQIRKTGIKAGLAINPETSIPDFLPLIDEVDSILFLTVNPGFYGSPFVPEVLDKITELRRTRPNLEIGTDGGVKEANLVKIARLGVDNLYVGSGIFLQPDPAEAYRNLSALLEKAEVSDG